MKVCIECNIEKEYKDFYKRENSKDGYRNNCKDCVKLISKKNRNYNREYHKEYQLKNKESIKVRRQEYYYKNKDKIYEYRIINKDSISEYKKSHSESYKSIRNLKRKEKINNDPLEKLKCGIRSSIISSFKSNKYKKSKKSILILGCSFEELKIYLESKFEDWMTWENRGLYNGEFNYGWDIDHITPSSSAETEDDVIRLNHYTNLQPLCSKINRDIKRDRLEY